LGNWRYIDWSRYSITRDATCHGRTAIFFYDILNSTWAFIGILAKISIVVGLWSASHLRLGIMKHDPVILAAAAIAGLPLLALLILKAISLSVDVRAAVAA